MSALRLVSADSHVNEPPEMFGERLDARFRDRAPRVETVDGVESLVMEGMWPRKLPKGRDVLTGEALERAQAGGWEPALRIRDQDRDGVSGEVVFPTLALQACFMAPDAGLQMALAQAYNSWVAEVFAGGRETVGEGAALLFAYSIGLGIPFLIAALFSGAFMRFLKKFRVHLGRVEKVIGALLVVAGVLFLTGGIQTAAYWLLETFPGLARLG